MDSALLSYLCSTMKDNTLYKNKIAKPLGINDPGHSHTFIQHFLKWILEGYSR